MTKQSTKTIWERFPELNEIRKNNKFPNHVFIIPDGNGRWAKKIRHAPPIIGHKAGAKILGELLKDIRQLPIGFVTIWGFACDNWKRSEKETSALMMLFEQMINKNLPDLISENNRLLHLGRRDRIPQSLRETIENAEKLTAKNTGQTFIIAIDYGGEDQELRVMQKLTQLKLPKGTKITQKLRNSLMDGNGKIPAIDLIIRTSGEQRISDVGQLARNAEFYFTNKLFPEIKIKDFIDAISDYAERERRFGARPVGK